MDSFYLLGAKKIFSFLKKALFVITVYFLIISLFIVLSPKNNSDYSQIKKAQEKIRLMPYQFINDQKIKNLPQGETIIAFYRLSNCLLIGETCSTNPNDSKNNYKNSLFGQVDNIFSYVFTIRPASFTYWVSNTLERSQLIPKSYAEEPRAYIGIGLQSLQAFYKLWENFRNLSFLLITLVLVTIGFMIMFRTKINPQTVISVENALPKIVITMIIITFSYPIIGLMVDLMYISLPIVSGLFANVLDPTEHQNIFNQFTSKNVFSIIFDLKHFWIYYRTFFEIITGQFLTGNVFLRSLFGLVFSTLFLFLISLFVLSIGNWITNLLGDIRVGINLGGEITANLVRFIVHAALGFVALLVLSLVIVVMGMFYLSFRIFFFLLSCLFNLIVYLIISPLYLLLEAVPGKSTFSSWLKNIIGNLAVFPAFLFLIMLVRVINNAIIIDPDKFFYLPGLTNNTSTTSFLASIIDIYIFLMIPDLLKLVKMTIIGKEGLEAPAGASILFGGATATFGSIMGMANQFYYLKMGYETLFGKKIPHGEQTGQMPPEGNNYAREIMKNIGSFLSRKK